MMIPTLFIITDNNQKLKAYGKSMEATVRVIYRSSVDGEKLYNTIEGVRFVDGKNMPRLNLGDNWRREDIEGNIRNILKASPEITLDLLKEYLKENGKDTNRLDLFLSGLKLEDIDEELKKCEKARKAKEYIASTIK